MSDEQSVLQPLQVHPLVEPAALKLKHADAHLSELGTVIRQFLGSNPLELSVDDADPNGWRMVRVVPIPQPPREWGVLLGDGIHDCRSALDNAVAALCRLAGGEPTTANEFPILVNVAETDVESKLARALKGIPRVFQQPIRDVQPYLLGDGKADHPLAVLQALSNADKHRLVHVGTLAPTEGQYRYRVAPGNRVVDHRTSASNLTLRSGSEVFRVLVEPDRNAAVDAELDLSLAVGFATTADDPPVATMSQLADVYRYLWELMRAISRVFVNYVAMDPPAGVIEDGNVARVSLSHEHDGERFVYVASGEAESLALVTGTRTYRAYACPRCQAVGYASVPGQLTLE